VPATSLHEPDALQQGQLQQRMRKLVAHLTALRPIEHQALSTQAIEGGLRLGIVPAEHLTGAGQHEAMGGAASRYRQHLGQLPFLAIQPRESRLHHVVQ